MVKHKNSSLSQLLKKSKPKDNKEMLRLIEAAMRPTGGIHKDDTGPITDIQFIVFDFFAGAGGVSFGLEQARHRTDDTIKIARVVACVNHDPLAIQSHAMNIPFAEHFNEDITQMYGYYFKKTGLLMKSREMVRLIYLRDLYKMFYPNAKIVIWGSLECTNFSNAKGGMARDNDSRTLADHMEPYIEFLKPDIVMIENVVEFMAWGPMVAKKGKTAEGYPFSRIIVKKDKKTGLLQTIPHWVPESTKNGKDWVRWKQRICEKFDFKDDWRQINSANLGAHTSRNRLFGLFVKKGERFAWPEMTHAKNPKITSMAGSLKKWRPVKEVLDFDDEGSSVFNRKKPLSTKTMQRFLMGCIKHIAGGKENTFITKYFSGDPASKNISTIVKASFIDQRNGGDAKSKSTSIELPSRVITRTGGNLQIVQASFLSKYNSNNAVTGTNNGNSIEMPCPVISTQNRITVATACFMTKYYGSGDNVQSINDPSSAIPTKDKISKVTAQFKAEKYLLSTNFNNIGSSIENPAPVITASRHHNYIVQVKINGNDSDNIDLVVARPDEVPLYLLIAEGVNMAVPVYKNECQWTVKLKEFMAIYGISDILMRMLKIIEIKRIQGFPEEYVILGNSTDQKKFLGNAVQTLVPKFWIEALSEALFHFHTSSSMAA